MGIILELGRGGPPGAHLEGRYEGGSARGQKVWGVFSECDLDSPPWLKAVELSFECKVFKFFAFEYFKKHILQSLLKYSLMF